MLFDKLISQGIISSEDVTIAIDATGFTSSYSSKYYVKRINTDSKSKHFLKSSIAIDVKNQLILAVRLRNLYRKIIFYWMFSTQPLKR